jgi:hypothetical protein
MSPRTFMNRPRRTRRRRANHLAVALYVNAAVLVGILAVLLGRDANPPILSAAFGQAQPAGIAGGGGLFLMPAQFSNNVFGCYIMDVDQQTLCAYMATGSPQQLKLIAARDIRYDRRLRNYNTRDPSPQEVQDLVAKEAASGRVVDRPPPQPQSPEQPPQSK